VRCFAEQAGGVIWFGLDGGGVCRWQDGKLTPFRASDGLASDYVRTLLADEDGALWIGTRGGLSRLKDGKLANVTARHGLPSEVICQILDDGKGHYWMSSFGGLFRVARAELNRCADGELKSVNCLVCDSSGGLGTLEVSEQGQPAGCRTSDGRLWFATGRGLAMVVPTNVTVNPLPPPVFIEEVLVDG
jgi:ligand-binding sensor domain-containing protein